MTDKHDVSDIPTTGHVWDDDLADLTNQPPKWWMLGLTASALFCVVYFLYYPSFPISTLGDHFKGLGGWTAIKEMEADKDEVDAVRGKFEAKLKGMTPAAILADGELSEYVKRSGKVLFGDNCAGCHGQNGIVAGKKVWLDENGHGPSADQIGDIVAPDDTTDTSFRNDVWSCVVCHSPHASDVVVLSDEPSITTSMILRKFPNPNKPSGNAYYAGTTGTSTITAWCSNCHEANFGSHTEGKSTPAGTRYGHDSSTTGYQLVGGWVVVAPDDATNTGPKCQQCHTADRAPSGISMGFPHAGGDSWKMLKASSPTGTPGPIEADKLDKLCASEPCHKTTDLP